MLDDKNTKNEQNSFKPKQGFFFFNSIQFLFKSYYHKQPTTMNKDKDKDENSSGCCQHQGKNKRLSGSSGEEFPDYNPSEY